MMIKKPTGILSEGMVQPAELDDERIPWVLGYLDAVWPEAYIEVDQTLEGWYPVIAGFQGRGHFSGAAPQWGWVYSSIDDPIGGAEGLLHEMGHHKLKLMGVYYEQWTSLLENDPSELYVSPIRKDKKRPMGAVLHAQYSYLYVTEFDRKGWRLGLVDEETYRLNQSRIAEGNAELRRYIRPTPEGKAFIDSVLRWGDDLCL